MRNTFIFTTLTALVASQGIADLPVCSLTCLTTAIGGLGCGITDFACSCQKASELTPVVTPCVQTDCSNPADQAKTIEVLAAICAVAGFPIEVPTPPASSAASSVASPSASSAAASSAASSPAASATPTPTASSEAPIETLPSATDEPEYPEYPTATVTPSEYPAPTHATDDVPNLPSSYSAVPIPSFVDTASAPYPSVHTTSGLIILPPSPTGSWIPSASAPNGTVTATHTSSRLPEFTGAAAAAQVPLIAAGVFGLAAFVL
ncbi:hypothetical protein C7974DRAFT_18125 [Boeremia exigua]|uniref:uncharacterized protein n=1 Tax=Boeremia exigua TaxID=749465 RepID=UPI001E8D002A|nr:uncharacterized protein C7974DRAFT_18125 [Boeremia exigua]KAH6644296.1 hypothetical protein C7974DRAFT_18125 [Boeremia exigua]